jgi:hypothetical protein
MQAQAHYQPTIKQSSKQIHCCFAITIFSNDSLTYLFRNVIALTATFRCPLHPHISLSPQHTASLQTDAGHLQAVVCALLNLAICSAAVRACVQQDEVFPVHHTGPAPHLAALRGQHTAAEAAGMPCAPIPAQEGASSPSTALSCFHGSWRHAGRW